MAILDFSIHFTPKSITMEDVGRKVKEWMDNNPGDIDIPGDEAKGTDVTMHHCFIPRRVLERRGMDTNVCDCLDSLCKKQVSWYSAADGDLAKSRQLMLDNLSRLNGIALFVGPITGGLRDEKIMAGYLSIDNVEIP